MEKRKLILVIVERQTDEMALSGVLRKTMDKSAFSFKYIRGNLFTDKNILIKETESELNEVVEEFYTKNPQYRGMIDCFVQITDTDGCFLQAQHIEEGGCETQYLEDKIITPNRSAIIERNTFATQKIYKFANMGIFQEKPFFLLFLSREQEHVLHNEIKKLSTEEKANYAKEFRRSYRGHEIDFKKFICNGSFVVQGNYKETWEFIRKGNHSLQRYSNLHLIYHIVDELKKNS